MIIATRNVNDLCIPGFTDFILYDDGNEEIIALGADQLFFRCMKEHIPEFEEFVAHDPRYAYLLALTSSSRLVPVEWETSILKSPEYALKYATNILHKPWPEAEEIIQSDPTYRTIYLNWIQAECPNKILW